MKAIVSDIKKLSLKACHENLSKSQVIVLNPERASDIEQVYLQTLMCFYSLLKKLHQNFQIKNLKEIYFFATNLYEA